MASIVRYIKRSEPEPYSQMAEEAEDTNRGETILFESRIMQGPTFTVDSAVDSLGFGRFQMRLSILLGVAWMADSMEMMLLSVLSPALQCEWQLSKVQQAFISTFVFGGMLLSGALWGILCDVYGRRNTIILSTAITAYFGLLSSAAPVLSWMLVLRGLVGIGIGGAPQSTTLYAEFLPSKVRGRCLVLTEIFWGIGCVFLVLLALGVMPTLGWRWLLGLASLPLVVFLILCTWLPESARYQLASGNTKGALTTLQRIALQNRRDMPPGTLVDSDGTAARGRLRDLVNPPMRHTTLLLWPIWLACAFCYYGLILLTTEMLASGGPCRAPGAPEKAECECRQLTSSDYVDLLVSALAEFPGLFLTIPLVDMLGRRRTLALLFALFGGSIFILHACVPRMAMMGILFAARCFISGAFQVVYVYTPEVYPTTMRAVGLGAASTMARIGALLTPFIAQVVLRAAPHGAIAIYGVVSLLAAVASMLLPIETRGRGLQEAHVT